MRGVCVAALSVCCLVAGPVVAEEGLFPSRSHAAACRSLVPASVGGPMPPSGMMSIRWLGTTNFEIAYRGQIVLFDTHYDRGPRSRPIGVLPGDIARADLILLGHAHFDHMSDIQPIAASTGAPVLGAKTATDTALSLGVPADQLIAVTGTGGERFDFGSFSVEPILAQHSTLDQNILNAFSSAITLAIGTPTAEEAAAEAQIRSRGTFAPEVITQGTIAYLLTVEDRFRLIYRNSAGPITPYEQQAMERIGGRTDVAIVAYTGQYDADRQVAATLPIVRLYHPRLMLPAHHDELVPFFLDMGIEPLLTAVRDQLPHTRTASPLYREPVCIRVRSKHR
jgi:L-ascorbate metabolism protein UlaG (beta-lactamase superfamily)